MRDVDVVHDHTLVGPLYRHPRAGAPLVTSAHGPFDETLSPVYRAMRGVAVVAISWHQAASADGVPLAGVIHHGLDAESVPVGGGNGVVARAAGVPLRMAAKLREPAERQYFDAQVKPLLCSDVEFLGSWAARRSWNSSAACSPC